MPFKSQAQRRFFHAAEKRGEISPKVVNEFDQASKGKKLPEKVGVGEAHVKSKLYDKRRKFWRGGCV